MSSIKGKDTKPEVLIRKALHKKGFRYKLHDKKLPGKPDIVLPKYRAIIEINGCFWHGHNCHIFKPPTTREEFWKEKIKKNQERDTKNYKLLRADGWKVLIVWECAIVGKTKNPFDVLLDDIEHWILHGTSSEEISGGM